MFRPFIGFKEIRVVHKEPRRVCFLIFTSTFIKSFRKVHKKLKVWGCHWLLLIDCPGEELFLLAYVVNLQQLMENSFKINLWYYQIIFLSANRLQFQFKVFFHFFLLPDSFSNLKTLSCWSYLYMWNFVLYIHKWSYGTSKPNSD